MSEGKNRLLELNEEALKEKAEKIIPENIKKGVTVFGVTGDLESGGTSDYEELNNKPQINSVTLKGNKTAKELNLQPEGDYPEDRLTNSDIEDIINTFVG